MSRQPLSQGDLSYLCGLYAVANAYDFLVPARGSAKERENKLSQRTVAAAKAIESFKGVSPFVRAFMVGEKGGLRLDELEAALESMARIDGQNISIFKFPKETELSKGRFWEWMMGYINQKGAIILGLHDHWTAIVSGDGDSLTCKDSLRDEPYKILKRDRCRLYIDDQRYSHSRPGLCPSETLAVILGMT